MTLVKFSLTKPGPFGLLPARGSLLLSPNERLYLADSIEVPDPFRVRLGDPWIVGGVVVYAGVPGVAWADLAPTTADWAWKVWERVDGGSIHYKEVPNQPVGFIEYDDLIEVDPGTLSQTPQAVAVFQTAIDALQIEIDANGAALAQITAGAGPAYDTFVELMALLDALEADTTDELADLLAAIALKADASALGTEVTDRTNADIALQAAISALHAVAASGDYSDLDGLPTLGTAAATDADAYATAAQGSTADTAVQPGDLHGVATSGDYADLDGLPTLGTAAAANTGDFATAAQGTTADATASGLAAEITDRGNADTALQGEIDAAEADLAQEVTDRTNGDIALADADDILSAAILALQTTIDGGQP